VKLANKIALVTGSSVGIGAGIARALAAEGADVIVHYRRDRAGADETAGRIEQMGRDALVVQADVGVAADVRRMFDQVRERYSRLDILVNNVGIYPRKPFLECAEDDWDYVINTNLKSMFLCCRQAVPLMTEGGAILNISSILGFNTLKNCTMYAASKGGVEGFSRALAVDLAQKGIRVNVLRPGMVNVERDTVSPDDPLYDEICARILAGRPGTVEDMAPMAVLLCSEDAGFITGQTICADGGQNVLLSAPFAMGFSSPEGDLKDLPDH